MKTRNVSSSLVPALCLALGLALGWIVPQAPDIPGKRPDADHEHGGVRHSPIAQSDPRPNQGSQESQDSGKGAEAEGRPGVGLQAATAVGPPVNDLTRAEPFEFAASWVARCVKRLEFTREAHGEENPKVLALESLVNALDQIRLWQGSMDDGQILQYFLMGNRHLHGREAFSFAWGEVFSELGIPLSPTNRDRLSQHYTLIGAYAQLEAETLAKDFDLANKDFSHDDYDFAWEIRMDTYALLYTDLLSGFELILDPTEFAEFEQAILDLNVDENGAYR